MSMDFVENIGEILRGKSGENSWRDRTKHQRVIPLSAAGSFRTWSKFPLYPKFPRKRGIWAETAGPAAPVLPSWLLLHRDWPVLLLKFPDTGFNQMENLPAHGSSFVVGNKLKFVMQLFVHADTEVGTVFHHDYSCSFM